jgi:hypothetical protein
MKSDASSASLRCQETIPISVVEQYAAQRVGNLYKPDHYDRTTHCFK